MKVLDEVPPVVDEKWKTQKCKCSKKVNSDRDQFLEQLEKQNSQCPCCYVPMVSNSFKTPYGTYWEYYRCPVTRWYTKCYVTRGAAEANQYLQRVCD